MTWYDDFLGNDDEESTEELPENLEDLEFPDAEDWEELDDELQDIEDDAEDDLIFDAPPDGFEYAHHFDFVVDALNYAHDPHVPHGVLVVVINDDGTADVYRTNSE